MVVMLWFSLDHEPMNLSLLKTGDWPGIATMAVGPASLQTVLEEGNCSARPSSSACRSSLDNSGRTTHRALWRTISYVRVLVRRGSASEREKPPQQPPRGTGSFTKI